MKSRYYFHVLTKQSYFPTGTLRYLIQGEALIKSRLEFMSKFDKQLGSNNSGEDGKNFICV